MGLGHSSIERLSRQGLLELEAVTAQPEGGFIVSRFRSISIPVRLKAPISAAAPTPGRLERQMAIMAPVLLRSWKVGWTSCNRGRDYKAFDRFSRWRLLLFALQSSGLFDLEWLSILSGIVCASCCSFSMSAIYRLNRSFPVTAPTARRNNIQYCSCLIYIRTKLTTFAPPGSCQSRVQMSRLAHPAVK